MSLDALLGGLIGSVLTVIARELLELFRDSKQHKYSLQKHYFEKKLRVAEAASSAWFKTARSFSGLESLYEQLSLDKKQQIDEEVFHTIHDNFSQELNKHIKETDEIANSIFLYFDIDDSEYFETESLTKLVESLSKIKSLNDKLNMLFDVEERVGDSANDSLQQEIIKTKEAMREEFGNYVLVLKKAKDTSLKLLKKARQEIKKHEP